MKELIDGHYVMGRIYYFLLDWNESDSWETMIKISGQKQLQKLTIEQFTLLFEMATHDDLETLKLKNP